MAKKVRRVRKARTQKKPAGVISKPAVTPPLPEKKRGSAGQFQQEYAYVVKDLRRIFALAAAMFILLILLNLIWQQV